MQIDHIGIAVRSLDAAVRYWQDVFGYRQATEEVTNSRQKVKVVFMEKADSLPVKLISPSSDESPLRKFLAKGEGLHHLCFRCDDLAATLSELSSKGVRTTVPPQPGEAFDNEPIAFVFARTGLNIEIIDTGKRAKRLLR